MKRVMRRDGCDRDQRIGHAIENACYYGQLCLLWRCGVVKIVYLDRDSIGESNIRRRYKDMKKTTTLYFLTTLTLSILLVFNSLG